MSTDHNKDSQKKGRPTPSRKESQAKRVTSSLAPATTKEAKRRQKENGRAARMTSRAAFLRGEESAMPSRDAGPARRFVRNFVDSKRSIGEFFLPIIGIVLVLSIIPSKPIQYGAIALMYGVLIISLFDGFLLTRKIKKEIAIRFPGTSTKGLGLYGWLRSTQMRRLRTPHCQVKAGDTNF
ncbi:unannotated protein [freshwater metagenome]|uniref:Unannotated protein n=1 Tax=freshwater metagenome TaxID=449393 RepID=A0A6J7XPG3_9ZZZZ|nr:DUF3043 domain-containing protein [Actinomycetota bacterium]